MEAIQPRHTRRTYLPFSSIIGGNEAIDDRVAALLTEGAGADISYDDGAGTLTITVDLSELSTTTLPEGANLYYTNERVDDRVAALFQDGGGITWTYDDGSGTLTGAVAHNSVTGLQGGASGEYNHLTNAEYAALANIDGLNNNRVLYSDGAGVIKTEAAFTYDESINTLGVGKLALTPGGDGGIAIISPNTDEGQIYFGDTDDADIGRIVYNHATDGMEFYAGNDLVVTLSAVAVFYNQASLMGSSAVPSTLGSLNVNNGLYTASFGADNLSNSLTDATTKATRVGTPHYTNSEEPAAIFANASNSTNNTLDFGGGTSLVNASTIIRFFTAANNTTQTGTERLRIDSSGRIMIGGTVNIVGDLLESHSITAFQPTFGQFSWSNNSASASQTFYKSRGASINSHTVVQVDDVLGAFSFQGSDGTTFRQGAQIVARVDGTPSAGGMPGRLQFNTTPSASATPIEAMRIDSGQRIIIGGTASVAGPSGLEPRFQQHGINTAGGSFGMYKWSADALGNNFAFMKSRGAAIGTNTIAQDGDNIGGILAFMANGTTFSPSAAINFEIDGAPGASNDSPGRIVFSTTPDATAALAEALRISQDKAVLGKGSIKSDNQTAGIGYATGAGGTVTQLTSKATGVTLNRICGAITTHNAALAANTTVAFVFTNSAITAADLVIPTHLSGGTAGAYQVWSSTIAAGSCTIHLRNITAGSLSQAVVIGFFIFKGTAT